MIDQEHNDYYTSRKAEILEDSTEKSDRFNAEAQRRQEKQVSGECFSVKRPDVFKY